MIAFSYAIRELSLLNLSLKQITLAACFHSLPVTTYTIERLNPQSTVERVAPHRAFPLRLLRMFFPFITGSITAPGSHHVSITHPTSVRERVSGAQHLHLYFSLIVPSCAAKRRGSGVVMLRALHWPTSRPRSTASSSDNLFGLLPIYRSTGFLGIRIHCCEVAGRSPSPIRIPFTLLSLFGLPGELRSVAKPSPNRILPRLETPRRGKQTLRQSPHSVSRRFSPGFPPMIGGTTQKRLVPHSPERSRLGTSCFPSSLSHPLWVVLRKPGSPSWTTTGEVLLSNIGAASRQVFGVFILRGVVSGSDYGENRLQVSTCSAFHR